MGYAIMRFSKIKSASTGNGVLRHIRREVEIKTLSYPDRKNIRISTSQIKEQYQYQTFNEILKDKLDGIKPRKNAVVGLEFIFAYTPGCISEDNIKDWSMSTVAWLANNFGGTDNIAEIMLHNDEKSPHIHAVVIPMADGKLNCKHYINGPASCRALQDSYYEAVKDYGNLNRGINSKITKKMHESNKKWIATNAEKEIKLEAYKKTFGTADTWTTETAIRFERNKTYNYELEDKVI